MKKNRSPKNSSLISHTSYLKRKTNSRFTLIELLVVVAIIAILAGILMPALTSALRKAKIISCTGNQKMIGLALSMYAADNKEFFPSNMYTSTQPWHIWHRTLLMCGYMGKAFQTESQTYDNDKRGKNVLICPEDTDPATMGSSAASAKDFLSYGLSSSIATPKDWNNYNQNYYHYIPRHRLIVGSSCGKTGCTGTIRKSPQDTFIATDSFKTPYVAHWGYNENSHLDSEHPKAGIAPRHVSGVPITFVDGHVNFWSYPFHPGALNFESSTRH